MSTKQKLNQSYFNFCLFKDNCPSNRVQVDRYRLEWQSFNKAQRQKEKEKKRNFFSFFYQLNRRRREKAKQLVVVLWVAVDHFLSIQSDDDYHTDRLFLTYSFLINRWNFNNKYWSRCYIFLFFSKWIPNWSSKFRSFQLKNLNHRKVHLF
jgi:hypothetical protein